MRMTYFQKEKDNQTFLYFEAMHFLKNLSLKTTQYEATNAKSEAHQENVLIAKIRPTKQRLSLQFSNTVYHTCGPGQQNNEGENP